jgi:peptidoglycan/xylan/chitin deacetylase (PgdA/CDA1 family)
MKHLYKNSLHRAALDSGLSRWLARRIEAPRIITLHGVGDAAFPLYDFARLMEWLKRNFRVCALADLIDDLLLDQSRSCRGAIAITFDDGLRNQVRHAYPVLQALGLCATVFVCPGLVDSSQWLWNHEARARLRRLSLEQRGAFATDVDAPSAEVEILVAWMKTLLRDRRQDVEQALRGRTPGFEPSAEERESFDIASWEELQALDPAVMAIGSHTLNHPILTTLEDTEVIHELERSRAVLEQRLDRSVDTFCYPNGAYDARVREITARYYRAALSSVDGMVHEDSDPWAIHRIPASPHLQLTAWRLHRPTA